MSIVMEFASLINDQIEAHENIHGYLLKAEALAHVALSDDFLDYNKSIVTEYLCALRDIIIQSKDLNAYDSVYLPIYKN